MDTYTGLVEAGFDAEDGSRFEQGIMARTPVRRWGTPADYAPTIVQLLDPGQSYHTGDLITVDGGSTIF